MKLLKYILSGVLVTVLATSCDKDFETINTNPNAPVVVPSSNLMTNIIFLGGNQLYSTFVNGDMGACWAHQFSKVQYNDESRYIVRQSVIQSFWDTFYTQFYSDAVSMQKLAIAEGNMTTHGVSLVLQAYALSVLTDAYGGIPNAEAIQATEGVFFPKYDAQDVVYDSIFAKLDRANMMLASGQGDITPSFDIMYAGDASKWQKFANSLKIRGLMRISNKVDVSAELKATMAKPIFTSLSDAAKLVYLEEQPNANPMYETVIYSGRKEWKVAATFVNMLQSMNDPRLPVCANENGDGVIRGKPVGFINVPNDDYNYDNVSQVGAFYTEATAPAYFLSFSEFQFLLAEAAQKGWINGSAESYYNAGIAASMAENGITDGNAISTYMAGSGVAFNSGSALNQIGTQKWIALFGQGFESWTEWRRSVSGDNAKGIPALDPAAEAFYSSIPTRYNYPRNEQTTNSANYKDAVSNLLTGDDLITTKVWWMN